MRLLIPLNWTLLLHENFRLSFRSKSVRCIYAYSKATGPDEKIQEEWSKKTSYRKELLTELT